MKKSAMAVLVFMVVFVSHLVFAGDVDSSAAPTSADSAMNTLEDIYNILDEGTTNAPRTGNFTEPSAGPAPMGYTLTEVYDRAKTSSRPAKTGQIMGCADGDDGNLTMGVAWPNPRFTDSTNGTVTDNLTGLIWLKNANCNGTKTWASALTYCNSLANGTCDLTDGSEAGNWRLPNVKELSSLIDWAYYNPALSDTNGTAQWTSGNAFTGVQFNFYWSSTTYAGKLDQGVGREPQRRPRRVRRQ
jgi:hypothetical protein